MSTIAIIIISFIIVIGAAIITYSTHQIFVRNHAINDNLIKTEYAKIVGKHNKLIDQNAKLKAQNEEAKLKLKLEKIKALRLKVKNSK